MLFWQVKMDCFIRAYSFLYISTNSVQHQEESWNELDNEMTLSLSHNDTQYENAGMGPEEINSLQKLQGVMGNCCKFIVSLQALCPCT